MLVSSVLTTLAPTPLVFVFPRIHSAQSMLLKKMEDKGQVKFTYKPKVVADSQLPPPLPIFEGASA